MGRTIVTFLVSVVIDQGEEILSGFDLDRKLTGVLAEMENTAAKNFDIFDTNIETEDY